MANSIWHTKASEQVIKYFESSMLGLSRTQVEKQRQKFGANTLPEKEPDSLLVIFFRQFKSPLIYILVAASILILFIGEYTDSTIIFLLLIFNAIVGTVQEGKARNTLASLKRLVETKATVMRDSVEEIIPDSEVVVGDILVLHEGDKIPADARVITTHNLTVDEASLTGESHPVYKTSDPLPGENLPTAEQRNMLFKGTNIVAGSGLAIVVATGIKTVIGNISLEISEIESEDPIKRDITKLSKVIIYVTLFICTFLFVAGLVGGKSAKQMFTTVVSLSVSIIPEGLPIVLTLVLATGVWRMSKKNALVKKLQAVESLGQAQVIAVDKTGTITKNELTITQIYVDGITYSITGDGYLPQGEVLLDGERVSKQTPGPLQLAKIAALCSSAHVAFSDEKKVWQVSGDPTEAALVIFGEKLGQTKSELELVSAPVGELPFSYQNKYHAVAHQTGTTVTQAIIGAPEVIIKLSNYIWKQDKHGKLAKNLVGELEAIIAKMSMQGLRVLGVAMKTSREVGLNSDDVTDLTFVGLIGMKDVLRVEVKDALQRARQAGIKVVMITGDHKLTAQALAQEAGIFITGDAVLTGEEINGMGEATLAGALDNVSVFARVTPEHKMRIIQAYQSRGEIIAMTGDGVNDAPPLVAADLGVAMGKIGTEVAKEAADIILLDDNFGSIVSAVEEGRNIYKTIKKVILFLFSTSLGEVLTIAGSIFLGFPLPVLASQIIWLNFVTDGFLDISLGMEPKEKGLLKERIKHTAFVDGLMAKRMLVMSLPMAIGTLWLFSNYIGGDTTKAWTMSLTVLAVFQWFNAWNCRSESESVFAMNPFSNKYLLAATSIVVSLQLLAVYHPFMQKFLHTTSLSLREWVVILVIASSIILAEEIRKLWYRARTQKA